MNTRGQLKNAIGGSPSTRKAALVAAAGLIAFSAVGCGSSGESGGLSMPKIGGSSVPYGAECINHPNHLQDSTPNEERGYPVGTYGQIIMGDLPDLVDEGYYTPDGQATDLYGELMVDALTERGLLNSTRTPAPGQKEQALESFRLLQENFDKERYFEEHKDQMGHVDGPTEYILPIYAHAYGENSSEDDEYKICVAFPEEAIHEEYKK